MRILGIVALVWVMFSGAFGQKAQQFDIYRFAVPQGWERQDREGVVFLLPRGLTGKQVVLMTVLPSQEFGGDLREWFEQALGRFHQDHEVLERTEVQTSRAQPGDYPVLAQGVVVRDPKGTTQYRFYVAGQAGGRVALVMYATNSSELFLRYEPAFKAFLDSLEFHPAQASAPKPGPSAPPPTAKLPPVKSPTYADIVRLKLDPERQPLPDEFRCYAFAKGDDYSKPAFAFQFFGKNQYRTPGGSGTYALKADGSLSYVVWKSGPFAGSSDAFLLFDDYGQQLELRDVGPQERDYYCYQQGAREQVARLEFRFRDPQPGSYPCVRTDGSNQRGGTLEILPGRRYRFGGGEGRYTADVLGQQDEDYGRVEFASGPLAERDAFYSEDETGLRQFTVHGKDRLECRLTVAKPTRLPRFGPAKAPPPPPGSGGLEGRFYSWGLDVMASSGTPRCGGLCWDLYFFHKNGYVYTGEPEEGLEEADCSRTKPNGFPVCEVYRVQGNQIVIGGGKPVAFQRSAGGLKLGGKTLTRLEPLDGLKLQGRYRSLSAFSTSVGGSGGGFSEVVLTFGRDGRFVREGVSGYSFNATDTGTPGGDTTAGVAVGSQRSNSGTYRFFGNTLELEFGDGRVVRYFAFVGERDKGGKVKLLRLGGRDYSLEEK
ncbi:hypothetical protein [Calidithermus chliarophilus]|uniref:hypothetical protein n=1 Tax=Calidithermus chliarophilus TaxID=52023 RepID=UPI000409CB61|nr:hypothetical protein [Calidithermus chliarophilus]